MAHEMTAELVRIELFEDRVCVTRRVVVPLGVSRLRVGPLSPLVRRQGLLVEADSADAYVEEVSVVREQVRLSDGDTHAASQARAQLDAATHTLDAAKRSLDDASFRKQHAADRVVRAGQWAKRAYNEVDDPVAWVAAARTLHEALASAGGHQLEAAHYHQRASAEVQAAAARLRAAREGRSALRSFAEFCVRGPDSCAVTLRYTIPCAVWRPVHRATLRGDTLTWQLAAMVWNHTGEDWTGASLVCSTARPGDTADAPVLSDDRVRAVKRSKEVVVEQRDEDVHVAREGAARRVDDVPGVDDGGEVRTFTVGVPVDLPSTGRPYTVPLDEWSSPATVSWLAAPESSASLVRVSRQHNAGSRPLLAGPVELFGDSGALGRTQIGLVGVDEPFVLGWGAHDDVVIHRHVQRQHSEARLTGRTTHRFVVTLRVANTGSEPVLARIRERVAVSELSAVKVSTPVVEPPLQMGPDADGLCEWSLALQPQSTQELTLSYTIEAGSSVQLPL